MFVILAIYIALTVGDELPRVAVCFFGLPRAINLTLPNIQKRLLLPLRAVANVSIYVHTFDITVLTNHRSKEYSVQIRPQDVTALQPISYIIESQDEFLRQLPTDFCRSHGDAWHDNYSSLRNFMCQLHSLRRVTDLMLEGGLFENVVFARPDVQFFNTIEALQVLASEQQTIYVPPFHNFGGVNDRFAFGRQDVMTLYGRREYTLVDYCKKFPAHSERYLHWYLERNKITIKRTPLLFGRVRSNGILWEKPSWIVERATKNVSLNMADEIYG